MDDNLLPFCDSPWEYTDVMDKYVITAIIALPKGIVPLDNPDEEKMNCDRG